MLIRNENFKNYRDGRPECQWRLEAQDAGIILACGQGPAECDARGARDCWLFEADGEYVLHYDGAGPRGWITCLATSTDLEHWERRGPLLELGAAGELDSAGAIYGVTYPAGERWHMFYLGSHTTRDGGPDFYPSPPYHTLKATADGPRGPWRKQPETTPFSITPGTYYSHAASPGAVVRQGDEYLQFFNASMLISREEAGPGNPIARRTLGLARTRDLDGPWALSPEPILPLTENVENADLYYQASTETWFLFTNHVGQNDGRPGPAEYTEAVWVYWTQDLCRWDAANKAVVLDDQNIHNQQAVVGLPTVLQVGDRLAIVYDAPADRAITDLYHSVGLAWLDLPLDLSRPEA